LTIIQNELFIIGSDLANPNPSEFNSQSVENYMINKLEETIDSYEHELLPITFFILPGGSIESSYVHIARSIARRVETNITKLSCKDKINPLILIYLNRLSDLLFVLARVINKRLNVVDVAWKS
jgi:cob(I)alamin adenosyltransferase